jgi:hypothetical protein
MANACSSHAACVHWRLRSTTIIIAHGWWCTRFREYFHPNKISNLNSVTPERRRRHEQTGTGAYLTWGSLQWSVPHFCWWAEQSRLQLEAGALGPEQIELSHWSHAVASTLLSYISWQRDLYTLCRSSTTDTLQSWMSDILAALDKIL